MKSPDTPAYMIGVAAELVGMHPQTLRIYETRGLVRPRRTPGGTRLYSDRDIIRLRRIAELAAAGLSLQGAELVLGMEDQIRQLTAQVEELSCALDEAARTMERELAQAHRSYRHELVRYQPGAVAIIRPRR